MNTRIAKFIADAGAASRRDAERMIADGRVAVNGTVIDTPVFFVSPTDSVTIDGHEISCLDKTEIYAFHKPINTMTTARDPMGRKTIYDCIPQKYRNLKYIGRLDYKTTGLLLLTNDGDVARKLTLPSSNVSRTYIAHVGGDLSGLDRARRGITTGGVTYRPMKIEVLNNSDLRVTVTEGKKNEVRIVLAAVGAPVKKLHRVSFANVTIGNLSVGQIIKLPQKTIDAMLKTL